MRNKKGVSPVIATVLLIGMVIVLSLIVFVWMKALAQETVTKFGGENVELACEDVSFEASYDSNILTVSNTGNVPIFRIKVQAESNGNINTYTIKHSSTNDYSWDKYGLDVGEVYSEELPELSGKDLKVIPVLLGNTEKGKKKTHTCDERFAQTAF